MDARRRQWQPISTHLPQSRTAHLLAERFGSQGPFVWVLVLLAAKRSHEQGTFRMDSESDGWERLGWDAMGLERPDFTLKDFFAYTGQIRRTRKRDGQQTEIRAWGDWNQSVKRQLEAEKKARKRGTYARDIPSPIEGTDSDLDSDSDKGDITDEQRAQNLIEARRLEAELRAKIGVTR